MDTEDKRNINLSLVVHGLRIQALEKALTNDQRKVFEASLLESKEWVRTQLATSLNLNLQQIAELLDKLDPV